MTEKRRVCFSIAGKEHFVGFPDARALIHRISLRHALLALAVILFVYFSGLLILWKGGGYIYTESGKVRHFMTIPTLISASDIADWQPLLGHFQDSYVWPDGRGSPRCDLIGWVYFPFWKMIKKRHEPIQLLDERGFVINWLDDSGTPISASVLPKGFRFHPLRGGSLRSVFPVRMDVPKDRLPKTKEPTLIVPKEWANENLENQSLGGTHQGDGT